MNQHWEEGVTLQVFHYVTSIQFIVCSAAKPRTLQLSLSLTNSKRYDKMNSFIALGTRLFEEIVNIFMTAGYQVFTENERRFRLGKIGNGQTKTSPRR